MPLKMEKIYEKTRVKNWLFAIAATLALSYAALGTTASNASALSGMTTSDVSLHNTTSDCLLIVGSKVYNLTNFLPIHSGGSAAIALYCGKNATAAFASFPHPGGSIDVLAPYYVGDVVISQPPPVQDTIPPTVTIVSPANTTYTASTVGLNYTTVDNAGGSGINTSACRYALDTGPITSLPDCASPTMILLAGGAHTITVYAKDNAGNSGNASVSFTVNVSQPPTPPIPPVINPPAPNSTNIGNSTYPHPYHTPGLENKTKHGRDDNESDNDKEYWKNGAHSGDHELEDRDENDGDAPQVREISRETYEDRENDDD